MADAVSESPERSVTITITGTLGDPDDLAAGVARVVTDALRRVEAIRLASADIAAALAMIREGELRLAATEERLAALRAER